MSKRDFFGDPNESDEGPASKMRKVDDSDEGGGSGRSGRVRKKSAKVLEMEEFEQAEKSSSVVKKTKNPKGTPILGLDATPVTDIAMSSKKSKAATSAVEAMLESTPLSRKNAKTIEMASSFDTGRHVPAELSLRTPAELLIAPMDILAEVEIQQDVKPEVQSPSPLLATVLPQANIAKQEDPKSVIKYLLSSPAAGTPHHISTGLMQTSTHETPEPTVPSKKSSKKIKFEDKTGSTPKIKEKKVKIEIMSPSELGPPVSSVTSTESKGPGLKMKIMSGSNPMTAQVALESGDSVVSQTPKTKKASKKAKTPVETDGDIKLEIAGVEEEKGSKKKKVSKKKEKLIQDAISAAQQMPNLAALVTSPLPHAVGLGDSPSPPQKPSKKKTKSSSSTPVSNKDANTSDSLVMDFDDAEMEDEAGESTLVIAETERKKKKITGKKKASKEKDGLVSPKPEKEKKIPKRAPTAYMLFCNSHRPAIVAENPGIEFASISRKLGELWQMQSNKQKLQWRRKAQRRMKKSNLISTGKVGKESQSGASTSSMPSVSQVAASINSTNQKLAIMLQKSKPAAMDEGPLSPTKNFSIEPLDVAAHLKLLGESLSIIGMRLQEHKGMIAVQGSLSVLLDSLLCACGPLLCLTQQVPGMDGCSPLVHAQTLDSIAYVMPGL